jgi:hypothetical protein
MGTNKMPPVPPANRSPKGPGSDPQVARDTAHKDRPPQNPDEEDKQAQANIKQNTTNQGYQQDR